MRKWFKHNIDDLQDKRLSALIRGRGAEGYAVFYCIVAKIYEQEGEAVDHLGLDSIADTFGLTPEKVIEICDFADKNCGGLLKVRRRGKIKVSNRRAATESDSLRCLSQIRSQCGSIGGRTSKKSEQTFSMQEDIGKANAKQVLSNCQASAKQVLSKSQADIDRDKDKDISKEKEYIEKEKPPYSKSETEAINEIVSYLNCKAGTDFKPGTRDTREHIRARLREGFTVGDFKKVVDTKVKEWRGTKMAQFLRPMTLFSTKFESYLNQNGRKKEPSLDFDVIEISNTDGNETEEKL